MKELNGLSKESLIIILEKMTKILSNEQYVELEKMVEKAVSEDGNSGLTPLRVRMSQELVNEKMDQIKTWMEQIDEGEIYLDVEEYEDYTYGYWDSDWITEYYDNQGIGDKIMTMVRFVKDCIDDRKYQEANFICEWLWEMTVGTDSEYESESVDLELLAENGIIHIDLKQFALQTLYVDYQVQMPENRAQDIYLYFTIRTFQKLHMEEMFHAGVENLTKQEQFWKDWIALLKTKSGDAESRLLQEAVLFSEGIDSLIEMADENSNVHPSLYLAAMGEYERNHDYEQIEKIGLKAIEKLDVNLVIRSKLALKAAYASSNLGHKEKMMKFCWESFRSDSTEQNFLRLFGIKEMADIYGKKGTEVIENRIKGNPEGYVRNIELQKNIIGDYGYLTLCFYTGNFKKVRDASKNPKGSLGWSGGFIPYGIRMILLYLYNDLLPSKAAADIAHYIGFADTTDYDGIMDFEREICEESKRLRTSMFWNCFQRWKRYFPMEQSEQEKYLIWAEKIVYSRADAIVGGQHRNHYADSAQLLAIVGEIKENMGLPGSKRKIFEEYKKKFPRHSSFQREMKTYFNGF